MKSSYKSPNLFLKVVTQAFVRELPYFNSEYIEEVAFENYDIIYVLDIGSLIENNEKDLLDKICCLTPFIGYITINGKYEDYRNVLKHIDEGSYSKIKPEYKKLILNTANKKELNLSENDKSIIKNTLNPTKDRLKALEQYFDVNFPLTELIGKLELKTLNFNRTKYVV